MSNRACRSRCHHFYCWTTSTPEFLLLLRAFVSRRFDLTNRAFISRRFDLTNPPAAYGPNVSVDMHILPTRTRRVGCHSEVKVKTTITAISYYGKPVLVSGNRGFSSFAGVFDQGKGRVGPAFLEAPPTILREACNAVRRFFRMSV